MAIYHFNAAPTEGIPIPPRSPHTVTEFFRLLAVHSIGAILLDQNAKYPLDITPPHSDIKYTLTLTNERSACLEVEGPQGDRESVAIPDNKAFVPILSVDSAGEPRLYGVIAALPSGMANVTNE